MRVTRILSLEANDNLSSVIVILCFAERNAVLKKAIILRCSRNLLILLNAKDQNFPGVYYHGNE